MDRENRTNDELDKILADIESKAARAETPTPARRRVDLENKPAARRDTAYVSFEQTNDTVAFEAPVATELEDTMQATRVLQVPEDDDVRTYERAAADKKADAAMDATRVIPAQDTENDEEDENDSPKRKKKNSEAVGCLKSIIYLVFVIGAAFLLAMAAFVVVIDVTALGRVGEEIDITVEQGATTQDVAELLEAEGIIEYPLVFRLYCRVMGEDGTFHPGTHKVSAQMGYNLLIDALQEVEVRETVTVTVPEGSTVEDIAYILQENGVCDEEDFFDALESFEYDEYDFFAEITEEQRKNRVYLAEGYLFPDTYEFYVDGAAKTVIETMLNNFKDRLSTARDSIAMSGKTLDEVIIEASIIQQEAGVAEDMPRVSRVIYNRLGNPSNFPRLEMDSTQDYLAGLDEGSSRAYETAYDTYVRDGLPVGAICNPGLEAINAVLNPSQEPDIINCFYFASIIETGETQFFETFAEHEAWCREHGVGMYG